MIYFITGRKDTYESLFPKSNYYPDIDVLEEDEGIQYFKSWVKNIDVIGFDTETNGLDANSNQVHFWIFGNEEIQFVFHCINIHKIVDDVKDKLLLGHNIKFDIKFLYTNTNKTHLHTKVYDTMIAEQRIYMKSGLSFALDKLVERYIGEIPPEMNKKVRNEFIDVPVEYFKVEFKHIRYGAGDIKYLFPIKKKQEILMEKYQLANLITKIEFPLIHIIAKAEVTGFKFDLDKWVAIAENNINKRYEIEKQLDTIVLNFIDTLPPDRKIMFDKKKFTNRPKQVLTPDEIAIGSGQTDLFGEQTDYTFFTKRKLKTPPKAKLFHFNYKSETQIIELFAKLQEPLLTNNESIAIPTFNKKGKIDKTIYAFKTGEDAFDIFLRKYPTTRMKDFIKLLIEHRGLSTSVNNFGKNYINKINPVTGNIHTVFRQCTADTGRFQSGGGRNEPDKINAQNIPRNKDMRNCFIARDGYRIGTHDYSGAELIIMSAFSNDIRLYEIGTKGDIHSFVAQTCWRAIYQYRANTYRKNYYVMKEHLGDDADNSELYPEVAELQKLIEENEKLASSFIVSKTENKDIRTDFKPMLFGIIYGMYAPKAGMTLNISKEEGQIVINIIKKEFPDVFRMVEASAAFALEKGYIIHNTRTYSRAWFPNIIKTLKGVLDKNDREVFKIISKEANEARNGRIQGTQADFMKEATVKIQRWLVKNELDHLITILSWVHDEIVDEHPIHLDGQSDEWKQWIKKNPKGLRYTTLQGESLDGLSFPEVKALIMEETANLYLTKNITIKAEYVVEPYWTKD